ncbi:M28 family peptidase [Candidatus Bathyarchaeota archaeon]|nr:M28 family peptidase [Candidatus Bathyarchaeota archaeon]
MENPYLDVDKKVLSEIYTSSEPLDNLTILCDVYGSRFAGTPGDKDSVEWMVKKLKEYGIENAHYENYQMPGWIRGPAKLEIISPLERQLECISLPFGIGGEVEGKLVDLGDGNVDIYEKRRDEINENIVMVSSRNPIGLNRHLHRREKYIRSVLAGAKGWIFVNQYPAYGPQTGGVSPIIPAISISYEDGCFLSRLIEREKIVKVRITTTDKNIDITSFNVVCDIPGTSDSKEYVLAGSHYDGHDISQGALDPASGAVTIIEMARVLNMVKDKIKRRIRLVCFGAEEVGLLGSYNYVEQHSSEMEDLRFMLNLDSAARSGKKGIILHDHPELETFMDRIAKEMKADIPYFQRVSPYSDHWPFFLKGVPCGSGGDPEEIRTSTGRGYGHTKFDTVDKVELSHLREAAANYARFLIRVANTDEWPARRKTQQEINEFVKKQGYDETVALETRVKNYVRTWEKIPPETKAWLERKSDW